eukprot:403360337
MVNEMEDDDMNIIQQQERKGGFMFGDQFESLDTQRQLQSLQNNANQLERVNVRKASLATYSQQTNEDQGMLSKRDRIVSHDNHSLERNTYKGQNNADYEMLSNLFDFDELKQSENFKVKTFNDAVYHGDFKEGKRHGFGVMRYFNGRIFEGSWSNDLRHGKGYEKYQNGNIFEGDFKNGKADGKGVYMWKNGEVYDGEWRNGVKEGYGIWKGIHGDSYIGEWKNSKADGYGVHQWKNGDRYEGEWKICLKHGSGTDIFSNGDTYTGQYKDGKPDGQGQYMWVDGSIYTGQFRQGQKHGKGKWRKIKNSQNCNAYEGSYEYDKKNGYGIFTWESGNYFKGNYVDDERQGYGEMYWIDGSYYQGQWKNGIQDGQGKIFYPDGRQQEGIFQDNIYIGDRRTITRERASRMQTLSKEQQNSTYDEQGGNNITILEQQVPVFDELKPSEVEEIIQENSFLIKMAHRPPRVPSRNSNASQLIRKNTASLLNQSVESISRTTPTLDIGARKKSLDKNIKANNISTNQTQFKQAPSTQALKTLDRRRFTNQGLSQKQSTNLNQSEIIDSQIGQYKTRQSLLEQYPNNVSRNTNENSFLPDIKRQNSKSSNRTQFTSSTEATGNIKVNLEAFNSLMTRSQQKSQPRIKTTKSGLSSYSKPLNKQNKLYF